MIRVLAWGASEKQEEGRVKVGSLLPLSQDQRRHALAHT